MAGLGARSFSQATEPNEGNRVHRPSTGTKQVSNPWAPPPMMTLGMPIHPQHKERPRPSREVPEVIGDIHREPPQLWAPLLKLHEFLMRQGYKVDVMEEEDTDPQMKNL